MNKRIIYTSNENKLCILVPSSSCELTVEEIAQKDVPSDVQYSIIDDTDLPQDIIFRDAWEKNDSTVIVNIEKAKNITHLVRRKIRAKEFEPYDKIIALQIPGNDNVQAEAKRAEIRLKYETIQQNIDASTTTDELKQIVDQLLI